MAKYLKLFDTHTEYAAYISGQDSVKPNVSYCKDNDDVHYNPKTWANEYMQTVALESGTISFNIWRDMGTDLITSISYSTDNGETWTTTENEDDKGDNLQISVNVQAGDKVLWKGDAVQTGYYSDYEYGCSFFSSTCEFDAKGNVMSLVCGDEYDNVTTISGTGQFAYLFSDCYNELECNIANARDLVLPATTLTDSCYACMFYNCTSLITAPELPATTLADSCYACMFYNCANLITAPELPVTELTEYCYNTMFSGCTSLVTAPELPATEMTTYCYRNMFYGCTSLVNAPELPATSLADSCYGYMFYGCTSLVTAPELPATSASSACYESMFRSCTSLANAPELPATELDFDCYQYMFNGCTSLADAPNLPATTLSGSCYKYMFGSCTALASAPEISATTLAGNCCEGMFSGCTSLTSAPVLHASELVNDCYKNMFKNCSSLNYIKAMFTTTPSTTYTNSWVSGVASSGTYVKKSGATYTTRGVNAIPNNWTIETASS